MQILALSTSCYRLIRPILHDIEHLCILSINVYPMYIIIYKCHRSMVDTYVIDTYCIKWFIYYNPSHLLMRTVYEYHAYRLRINLLCIYNMHVCYWSILHEVHTICMTTKLKYKKA